MFIYILAFSLTFLTVAVFIIGNQRAVSPSMLFMLPFCLSAYGLIFNISRWNVNLHAKTYFVIIFGCISYLLGIIATSFLKLRREGGISPIIQKREYGMYCIPPDHVIQTLDKNKYKTNAPIPDYFLWGVAALEFIILFLCYKKIQAMVYAHGFIGSISTVMYRFRNLGMYTTESVSLGKLLDWGYQFNLSSGYIWAYVLMHRIFVKNRISFPLLLCLIISLITGIIKGGRQAALQIIVAAMIYYMVLFIKQRPRKKIPKKALTRVLILVAVIAVSFQTVGTLMGRTVQADFAQYAAVYLCGGIQNLNVWLSKPVEAPELIGKYTFYNLYPYLGRKLNHPEWIYVISEEYLSSNGHNSGNIYTTFRAFYGDFGVIGLLVLPFIMGFISEFVFKKTTSTKIRSERVLDLSTILYGYIANLLVFSFFGNKFYAGFIRIGFIKILIMWVLIIFIVKRIPTNKQFKITFSRHLKN